MHYLKLYFRFIIVYLKTITEHKPHFVAMDVVINVLWSFISLVMLWVLLDKFGSIASWNFYEVLFLYNLNYFSFAVSALFIWNPMTKLEDMIRKGTFDGMLVKPLNPLIHMICKEFSHGHLVQVVFGIVMFVICFKNLAIAWTLSKVIWFCLVVMGAILIQSALMILTGIISFWFVKSTALVDMMIDDIRRFLDYPIIIYDKWVQIILTFIIPYAFVNFFPAQALINKTDSTLFHPVFQFITPLVGVVLLTLAYTLWKLGINRYQSTGS